MFLLVCASYIENPGAYICSHKHKLPYITFNISHVHAGLLCFPPRKYICPCIGVVIFLLMAPFMIAGIIIYPDASHVMTLAAIQPFQNI